MLKNVIDFVRSRTDLTRDNALREINFAWKELWNSDDLPNSVFELSVTPLDDNARISLPHYVGEIRGAKQSTWGRERVILHTPRPWYQDDVYAQSPFVWRILGTSPLLTSVTNASTVTLTFDKPVTERTIITLLGPNDNGGTVRDQITFEIADTTHESTERFTDFQSITKDLLTPANLKVTDANNREIAIIPNDAYEAKNTIVQITDKCFKICNWCRCFDVLYKKTTPILFYDETAVPFEEVLMAKTLEWIALPKDGQEQKAAMFADKARNLLVQFNGNEVGVDHKLDVGRNRMPTLYHGYL